MPATLRPQPGECVRARRGRWLLVVLGLGTMVLGGMLSVSTASATDDAPPFRIIVHPGNPISSATRALLMRAFLKETTRWDDGETIRPVDLHGKSDVRKKFSKAILKRSVAAVKSYWQQRIFSGRGVPPPEAASDAEVVRYVLKHRGAVGYVSADARVESARPIAVR